MKYVLLNSGGTDSLAVAYSYKRQGHEVHSLYINIGMDHEQRALDASQQIADAYCVSHKVIELKGLSRVIPRFGIQYSIPVTYQPIMMATLGKIYAHSISADGLISGNKGGATLDISFEDKFNACSKTYTNEVVHYIRPIFNLKDFSNLYPIIKDLPLLNTTTSCTQHPACGVCNKCLKRKHFNMELN